MAILQSSLSEEVLSRQERAVIRGIHHASQINEALIQLRKTVISVETVTQVGKNRTASALAEHISNMDQYLVRKLSDAILNTKVPASPVVREPLQHNEV
jgi:hypothetical protein